ncbi:hypothetical protein ACFFMN_28195 [Planobispora siamensis]
MLPHCLTHGFAHQLPHRFAHCFAHAAPDRLPHAVSDVPGHAFADGQPD